MAISAYLALPQRRGTITRFIDEHLAAWELGMGILSILYLALAIPDDDAPGSVPIAAIIALSGVFLLEFLIRFWDAQSRLAYFKSHWLDLVSCVPLVGGLRALRLLRLFRLMRVAAGVRAVATTERAGADESGSLWFLLPTLVIVWVGGACGIWTLEHGVNPNLKTFDDALYWSFTTATTVGYGDIHPMTAGGKLLSGLLAFVAIGMIGVTSSRLTAMWSHQRVERSEDEMLKRMEALQADVRRLQDTLDALIAAGHDAGNGRAAEDGGDSVPLLSLR